MTDGHTFTVADAEQAATRLQGLLDNAAALQTRSAAVVAGQESVSPVEFVQQYTRALAELDVAGANPNPMFTGMMALNTLRELGLSPETDLPRRGAGRPWSAMAETGPAAAVGRRCRHGRWGDRLADTGTEPLT